MEEINCKNKKGIVLFASTTCLCFFLHCIFFPDSVFFSLIVSFFTVPY